VRVGALAMLGLDGSKASTSAYGYHYQYSVTICHQGKTIVVSNQAVAAHQRHGDTIGACE